MRFIFGGTGADVYLQVDPVTGVTSAVGGAEARFYADQGKTEPYTALETMEGAATSVVLTEHGGAVYSKGQIGRFRGEDGAPPYMWCSVDGSPAFLMQASNLAELLAPLLAQLPSISGFGEAAMMDTGTEDGTVAAGDDARIVGAVQGTGGGREGYEASTAASGAKTINLGDGNVQELTLAAGSVTLTLAGATAGTACSVSLYLVQDGTGGRSVTWPAGVKWPGGAAPTLSAEPGSRDLVVLESFDGGTTWYGNLVALSYS